MDADGRLCAVDDGGIVCWRPADDGFVVDWQVSCGRVRGFACRADGLVMATVRRDDASRIAGFTADGREALTWGVPGDAAGHRVCLDRPPDHPVIPGAARLAMPDAISVSRRLAGFVNVLLIR